MMKKKFKNEKVCHICNKKFKKDYKQQLRDHDHMIGKYMGSAHL